MSMSLFGGYNPFQSSWQPGDLEQPMMSTGADGKMYSSPQQAAYYGGQRQQFGFNPFMASMFNYNPYGFGMGGGMGYYGGFNPYGFGFGSMGSPDFLSNFEARLNELFAKYADQLGGTPAATPVTSTTTPAPATGTTTPAPATGTTTPTTTSTDPLYKAALESGFVEKSKFGNNLNKGLKINAKSWDELTNMGYTNEQLQSAIKSATEKGNPDMAGARFRNELQQIAKQATGTPGVVKAQKPTPKTPSTPAKPGVYYR